MITDFPDYELVKTNKPSVDSPSDPGGDDGSSVGLGVGVTVELFGAGEDSTHDLRGRTRKYWFCILNYWLNLSL